MGPGKRATVSFARNGEFPFRERTLKWMVMAHTVLAIQVVLVCIVLLVKQDFLKSHAHYFYLGHYALFFPFLFAARDRCAFLFSPSFLIVSYICVSFMIGGFAFAHGYVLSPKDVADFRRWNHFNAATAYFMTCNLLAIMAYFLARGRGLNRHIYGVGDSLRRYRPQLVFGAVLLAVFSVVSVGLTFLGGSGDFSIVPRTFGFLVVCVALARSRVRFRFAVYVALLLLFAAAEYLNRRVVIVLIVSLAFLEAAHLANLRVTLRGVALGIAVLGLMISLQVTMTIARGVGGFRGSYWQTFREIGRFTGLENATTYSLKTTEGPALFFHSYNGVEYVLDDISLVRYGSTLVKVLFLVVPRSMWADKPTSIVHLYTNRWKPAWREKGGSACLSLYTEYFWNLHWFGFVCTLPIFYVFNRVFLFYLEKLRAGTVWPFVYLGVGHSVLLVYARGAGLDGLAVHVGLGFIIQSLLFNPVLVMSRMPSGVQQPSVDPS